MNGLRGCGIVLKVVEDDGLILQLSNETFFPTLE